jgi:hypothetical protein
MDYWYDATKHEKFHHNTSRLFHAIFSFVTRVQSNYRVNNISIRTILGININITAIYMSTSQISCLPFRYSNKHFATYYFSVLSCVRRYQPSNPPLGERKYRSVLLNH